MLFRSDQRSRADAEWLCRIISSKISLSLLSLPSGLSVSIVAVPTGDTHVYGPYLIFVAGSTHEIKYDEFFAYEIFLARNICNLRYMILL